MNRNKIVFSDEFKRKYKLLIKDKPYLKEQIITIFDLLLKDPLNVTLRVHGLKGMMRNLYALSIDYDLRIIFIQENNKFRLLDIGTHEEVYY